MTKTLMLAVLCACLAGCGGNGSNRGNGSGNQNANKSPAAPGSTVSNGQLQMGVKFPDWFPTYVGVDPRKVMAVPMQGDQGYTAGTFSTADPPEKVIGFYKTAFTIFGLTIKQTKGKDGPSIKAEGDGKRASVDVSAKDGTTTVGFSFSKKQEN